MDTRNSRNFSWLLIALLIFLVGVPVADHIGHLGKPITRAIAFSCLMGIGVISLHGPGSVYRAALGIVVVGVILNFIGASDAGMAPIYGSFAAILAFLVIAITSTFHRVATDSEISANRIVGAIVVYLLLGVSWAVGYSVVELLWPGSFSGFEPGSDAEWDSEWLYFSFVTMTTLGYGDIAPLSPLARVLAYMQAIFGQFYIAILVAGLVGAYIARND